MVATKPAIHSDPEVMSGTPVFVGTRVPVAAMFDYLAAGDSLDRFLDHFPSVSREQAVEALETARTALLEAANARAVQGAERQREAPTKLRSIGTVEGELKVVSFSETRPFFSIYRPGGTRGINCYFDEHRFLSDVLDNLRQRVLVAGAVSRAEDGTPVMVSDVRTIRRLGETPLPQAADLVGLKPELTGDLPSEEWLQRRRRG